jgi:hypothetical protein
MSESEMMDDQEVRTRENDEIVLRNCELIWESVMQDTKNFTDARRYVILSRVTGFMVANVYMPVVQGSVEDALGGKE